MNDRTFRGVLAALGAAAIFASTVASAEPALWTVKGRENTVYIYGSVHVLPQGGFAVDGRLAEALDDAEKVCLEIDSKAISDEEMQALTLSRVMDPDGRDLFTLMGPDADQARESATAAGVQLEPLAQFEPWFAGMMLSILALQQHGFDIEHGVESLIETAAGTRDKPICAFETADEQLAIFDDMPIEQQRKFLIQSLDEIQEVKADMDKMLAYWRSGDEASMDRLMDEDFEGYPELAERLVFGRNERWADQVSEMLDGSDDVLVVVGAGHLVGDRGLPNLLRKRGYKVVRD